MNIVVLNRSDWRDEQHVRLVDRRADHIRSVLRAEIGDSVRVGLLNGWLGQGRIRTIDASSVLLAVELNQPPPPRHRFDIVLCLPRPKVLRRLFRTVAEYGVANLHLIHSARVERAIGNRRCSQQTRFTMRCFGDGTRQRHRGSSGASAQAIRPFRRSTGGPFRPACWMAQMGAGLALRDTPLVMPW